MNRKLGSILLTMSLALFLNNCNEDSSITPKDMTSHSTEIKISEYVDNYFFLDPIYYERYDSLLQNGQSFHSGPSTHNNYFTVKNIEVWNKTTGMLNIAEDIRANTYVELNSIKPDSLYPETLRTTFKDPVYGESGINDRFRFIDTTDYEFYPNLGIIRINYELDKHLSIAVAYSIEGESLDDSDDIIFGEFINVFRHVPNSVKILKLIKPGNLSPSMTKVWPLKLRNIYNFNDDFANISEQNFNIKILVEGNEYHSKSGKRFLSLFNLDNLDSEENLHPDGIFDYLPNKSINLNFNEIIFPVLEPFGKNFPLSIEQQYQCGELYLKTKSEFITTEKDSIFKILVDYNLIE